MSGERSNRQQKQQQRQVTTPAYEAGLDAENVENLKASKKVRVVPGHPIVKDQKERIVDGRHRDEAGFTDVIHIEVEDDVEYWLDRLLCTNQRRSSQAEHMRIMDELCCALEAKGWSNKKITRFVLGTGTFGESYTYAIIPLRFKRTYSVPDEVAATAGGGGDGAQFDDDRKVQSSDFAEIWREPITVARSDGSEVTYMPRLQEGSSVPYDPARGTLPPRWRPAVCPHCLLAVRVMEDGTLTKAL